MRYLFILPLICFIKLSSCAQARYPIFTDTSKSPIYVIDGKIFHNRKIISGFRPSQIQSLDILSDSDAIALYGSQAKYGAIVIKLYTPVKHHVWKHAFWPWPKVLTIHRTGREYRRERRKQMRKGFIDWIE